MNAVPRFINFHHVPELSRAGCFVEECQLCGALVYSRHETRYKWQHISHGSRTHEAWHRQEER